MTYTNSSRQSCFLTDHRSHRVVHLFFCLISPLFLLPIVVITTENVRIAQATYKQLTPQQNQVLPSMPNPISSYQIQNFLSRHTIPVPIGSLPNDSPHDQECPICHIIYADPPSSYVHPDFPSAGQEYACEVLTCKHIFGRRCLEQHIRGNMPWSHTCPLCRTEWFPAPSRGRTDMLGNVETALSRLASVEVRDAQVRREMDDVERAIRRIREGLYGNRWI
jgi:hypothetical protein